MDGKRGDDAQDHVPQAKESETPPSAKQDERKFEERNDGERDGNGAIEVEDMNSANDEGAN